MTRFRIEFTTAAAREIRKLDPQILRRILGGVADFEHDPRPHGCRKLAGYDNARRIRVAGYRVLYEVLDEQVLVTVVRVAHRRTVHDI